MPAIISFFFFCYTIACGKSYIYLFMCTQQNNRSLQGGHFRICYQYVIINYLVLVLQLAAISLRGCNYNHLIRLLLLILFSQQLQAISLLTRTIPNHGAVPQCNAIRRGSQLSHLRRRLEVQSKGGLQTLTLSATITYPEDIRSFFHLTNVFYYQQSAARKLEPRWVHIVDERRELVPFFDDLPCKKLLVFANSRKKCEQLFEALNCADKKGNTEI